MRSADCIEQRLLLSGTLRKSRFSAVRAVVEPTTIIGDYQTYSARAGSQRLPAIEFRTITTPGTSVVMPHRSAGVSIAVLLLILLTDSLDVRSAVRIEELLAPLLPLSPEFGRCDVPIRPAFPGHGTQVLA